MQSYLIHYHGKAGGLCIDVQRGRDAFQAIAGFMELRKIGQIVSIRRLINGHNSGPVYL